MPMAESWQWCDKLCAVATYPCIICGKTFIKYGRVPPKFCSIPCKAEWQRRQKPVDREWLYQKYIVEELGAPDIARLVGRNSKRVWEWLRDYGIPTRPRGADQRQHFKPGDVSLFLGHKHTAATREQQRQRRIADGHVPYLQNGVHHLKGKRGADTPNWKGGVTPERQAHYSSDEWAEVVKAVWTREDAKCRRCNLDHRGLDRSKYKFHIHHIVSFAVRESRNDLNNVVLLCATCHRWVHSRRNTEGEFLK